MLKKHRHLHPSLRHQIVPETVPQYKVYYRIIPARDIVNVLIPPHNFNDYVKKLNAKCNFYDKLEKSVVEEGFRNPILISAGFCLPVRRGWLPKKYQNDYSDLLVCDRCGGSRLFVAQKLNIDIPCIISDFIGKYKNDGDELKNEQEILQYFKEKPNQLRLMDHGVHFTSLPHTHLNEKLKQQP